MKEQLSVEHESTRRLHVDTMKVVHARHAVEGNA